MVRRSGCLHLAVAGLLSPSRVLLSLGLLSLGSLSAGLLWAVFVLGTPIPSAAQLPEKPQIDPAAAAQAKKLGDQVRESVRGSKDSRLPSQSSAAADRDPTAQKRTDFSDENMTRVVRESRFPIRAGQPIDLQSAQPLIPGWFSSAMREIGAEVPNRSRGNMMRHELPPQIIRHLVSKAPANGLPIPPKADLVARARTQGAARDRLTLARRSAAQQKPPAPPATPKPLERCRKSSTTTIHTSAKKVQAAGQPPTMDALFIDAPSPPLNPEDLFGPFAQVYTPHSTKDANTFNIGMATGAVKCLPYRIRVIGDQYIIHQGEDAVRFYGSGAAERGQLKDGVKGKYW